MPYPNQEDYIAYGPEANCTVTLCPISRSIYQYRPSLPANSIFIALFGITLIVHILQGLRYKTTWFLSCMVFGCIMEVIGYGGRIMLYINPFSFAGFIMQIACITFAPAFFAAAIYFTLSKIVCYLDLSISRLPPKAYYYIFIPCDIISIVLQAAGGGLSSDSRGASEMGVNIAIAGLSFQVFTLVVFLGLAGDYAVRYWRSSTKKRVLPKEFKIFVCFLSLAFLLILVRCIYRIDELSEGYSGPLIHNEGLFIALEGV
ncbi:MAG: hypothetical protein Q9160_003274 [Pyrenula sp. 1 TL-2023]